MSLNINLACSNLEYKLEHALSPDVELHINASIVMHQNRYFCSYRSDHLFNYDGKNYITELDKNFNPISHKKLVSEDGNNAFEDIRLFSFNNVLMALYTYLPKQGNDWLWNFSVGISEVDLKNGKLINQQPLHPIVNGNEEKNWVPLIVGDRLLLIANLQPEWKILEVSGKVGKFKFNQLDITPSKIQPWHFGQLRGGTPFIGNTYSNDGWYYSFVHSHLTIPNGNSKIRYYVYTIVRINPEKMLFQYVEYPLDYSKSEYGDNFKKYLMKSKDINVSTKVVFPMGIINYKDGVLISYGKDDVVSRLKFYSWAKINLMFDKTIAY